MNSRRKIYGVTKGTSRAQNRQRSDQMGTDKTLKLVTCILREKSTIVGAESDEVY